MICNICPRNCGALRNDSVGLGICRCPENAIVARAAVHNGEEPCISGTKGSGTVFFGGCNLGCVFCQNEEISHGRKGQAVSIDRLCDIFKELEAKGVHNINLVTPTHYSHIIRKALEKYTPGIPVAYNCGGYESVESLRVLEGLIQIYMPDMKYSSNNAAFRYSKVSDYVETAQAAILEMYKQVGDFELNDNDIMKKGVLIRHLILPSNIENSFGVIDWVKNQFPKQSVLFSLMSQFTPLGNLQQYPEIARTLTDDEYQTVEDYLFDSGIEDGFIQDLDSCGTDLIPDFDETGV